MDHQSKEPLRTHSCLLEVKKDYLDQNWGVTSSVKQAIYSNALSSL